MMVDELNINNNYSILNLHCDSCGKNYHPTKKCVLLNPSFENEKIILRFKKGNTQQRQLFRNNGRIRFNSKKLMIKLNLLRFGLFAISL